VTLASAVDNDGFRAACRRCGGAGRSRPGVLACRGRRRDQTLFESGSEPSAAAPADAAPPDQVPAAFMALCESVVLHRDPGRFGLLYRLLWRLQTEPGLRHDALDPDWVAAQQMAQAVRRDMHKMTAFVRFRELDEGDGRGPLHVAWFEPEHHIVEATAPFFARRFTAMRWAILTPERSVHWDGSQLAFGPGAAARPGTAGRCRRGALLTYYRSIFNPARLKLAMMKREMPRKYWANLPEAALIDPLAAAPPKEA
jgi:DNA polymerase